MDIEMLYGVFLFAVLPVAILGFMVYLTYIARKAQIKNKKKEK